MHTSSSPGNVLLSDPQRATLKAMLTPMLPRLGKFVDRMTMKGEGSAQILFEDDQFLLQALLIALGSKWIAERKNLLGEPVSEKIINLVSNSALEDIAIDRANSLRHRTMWGEEENVTA